MVAILWTLTLTLACAVDPADSPETRKSNPFAPSLRLLTAKEEADLDAVIDRFILYDTGRLRGVEGRKALTDFQALGSNAIPALIRGINRAAKIEASCPAVTIGHKLASLLKRSQDAQLLEFARENIGAGITESRHMRVLKDLQLLCMMRKGKLSPTTAIRSSPSLPTNPASSLSTSPARTVSASQLLLEASELDPGPRRAKLVSDIDPRQSGEIMSELAAAATDDANPKMQQLSRELLEQLLDRQPARTLKNKLTHQSVEIQIAAARIVGQKKLPYEKELIDLLAADSADLRQAAHDSLVKLHPDIDFGPRRDADASKRATAVDQWRDWLAKQNRR
jgi:hypothetical protein